MELNQPYDISSKIIEILKTLRQFRAGMVQTKVFLSLCLSLSVSQASLLLDSIRVLSCRPLGSFETKSIWPASPGFSVVLSSASTDTHSCAHIFFYLSFLLRLSALLINTLRMILTVLTSMSQHLLLVCPSQCSSSVPECGSHMSAIRV